MAEEAQSVRLDKELEASLDMLVAVAHDTLDILKAVRQANLEHNAPDFSELLEDIKLWRERLLHAEDLRAGLIQNEE